MLMLLAITLAGCNTSQQQRAYQSLEATSILVEEAALAFGELNAQGLILADQYDQAQAVYENYQDAMNFAINVAENGLQDPTSDKVLGFALEFINLIESYQ